MGGMIAMMKVNSGRAASMRATTMRVRVLVRIVSRDMG
jgi:hypothetical protein